MNISARYQPAGIETSVPTTGRNLPLLTSKTRYGLSIVNTGRDGIEIRFTSLPPAGIDIGQSIYLQPGQTSSGNRQESGSCGIYVRSLNSSRASRIYYTFITER